MSCATPKSKILSKIDLEAIQDEHEGLFIKGINFNQQRSIVKSIANELYRNSISGNKETSNTIKEKIVEALDAQIKDYDESIDTFRLLDDEDSVISVLEQKGRLVTIKENLDKLIEHSNNLLNTFNSVKVKDSTDKEDSEDVVGDNPEGEAQLDRNNHSNNFYLELNSRDTVSSRLKKFLAFVEKKEFVNEKPVAVKNVIGFTDHLEFEYVFNELHKLLSGTRAKKEDVLKTLQDAANEAQQSSNKTLAWLQDFITYYNQAPSDIQREFVSEMAKHRIEMMFVDYNIVEKTDEQGKKFKEYQLRLNTDDSGAIGFKVLANWKKDHTNSNIVEDNKYSEIVKQQIISELARLRNPENKDIRHIIFNNIMGAMGMTVHPKFVDNFLYGKGEIRTSERKKGYKWFEFLAKGGVFEKKISSLPTNVEIEEIDLMNDNVIKGIAFSDARYEDKEFSNSFRVADKTIYTYSMNQYLVNRVRDLLANEDGLRDKLSNTIFAEDSLYLSQLSDPNSGFREWFDVDYLSLNPLKVRKGKRSDSVTEMSPLDYEVTKWGHYNSFGKHQEIEIKGLEYKVKNATYFFPTNSDKTRVMTVKGLAFETTENNEYTNKSLDLFYEYVVLPEIKRINKTSSQEFKKSANLKTFNGGLFYLLPSLNNLVFKDGQSLLDVARATDSLTDVQKIEINNEIKRVLSKLVDNKLNKWNEVGIIEKDSLKHLSKVLASETTDKNPVSLSTKEMVMNFVFNSMLANANMYQLIIGDPAQYNKGGSTIEAEIKATYDNITKRLAAEIAPGIEMEGKDYFQIYADEIVTESEQYEYYKSIIGGDAEAYKKMKEADAQEYTTYTEHLNILKYLGRITDEEYKEAKSAFDEGKNPSPKVFESVLQPLKPVFVWNDIIKVGEDAVTGEAINFDRKTYIKSSSFPLIPTLTKGLQLDRLRVAMEALENSNTKNPDGLGVRLAISSAVKVGMPLNSLKLTKDSKGNLADEINLEGKYTRLKREGFRIQQDIPYDETVKEVQDGSQQKKLLFTNYSNPKLEALYINTYKQLYKLGLDKFKSRILNNKGEVDNNKISQILTEELRNRGETFKPLYDGLKVLDNEFNLPLWLSPYADTYMSLLNSIVKNTVISHKIPGKSFVLGSEFGFKPDIKEGEEGQEFIDNNKTGIIFTDSYNPTKGLQGQRTEDGVVKGAQVLIPFKFRDSEGKLLYAEDFVKDGKIDYTKLPKELLEMFGFRIPTQLHASMSYIEVAGFLPKVNGDLVIAPAEFTVQMGSDFDVDKLYTYMFAATYNKETKSLSKTTIEEDYKLGLTNRLLDIHLEVMQDKELQKNIHSPLGFGLYTDVIKTLQKIDSKPLTSLLSDQYQEDKFFDGTSGKNGIGMFSSDSIFNALAQNKDLTLISGRDLEGNPIGIKVEFGNKYNTVYSLDKDNKVTSNLSNVKSQKKENPRNKTEVIAAAQNLSVDNANEQGMYIVNMNSTTFGVYSILNFLGFEEDISAPFMAQPIIKDYVRKMRNKNSILTEFNPNVEREIVEELQKSYSKGTYSTEDHSKLADFRGKDASKEMLEMIEKGDTYSQFGITQAAILDKFIYLKKIEAPIGPIKQLLNLDSKGFSKNMYINKRRLETLAKAPGSLILNADNLFGEYIDNAVIPTTTAGFDNIYGNQTLVNTFGEYFLESNSAMEFDSIVKFVEKIKGNDRQLGEKALVNLKNNYKNYLLSNINVANVTDIDAIRKDLLLNKSKGSFYDRLTKFKNTPYGKENRFLNNITVTFDKLLEVDYDNSGGDMFDESSVYKSFVDLFMDSNDRNGIIPSDLVEELVVYSLLRGGNKAQQFIKFIPISALTKILKVPEHGNTDVFVDQWVRHNPQEAILVDKKDTAPVTDTKVIKLANKAPYYVRVEVSDKKTGLYKFIPGSENNYVLINTLGTTNTTEYTPYQKNNSLFAANNVRNIKEEENPVNPLDTNIEVEREVTGTPSNTEVATTDLDFSSLQNLLGSITSLDSTKYADEIKLAKVLLPNIDLDTRLTREVSVTIGGQTIGKTSHYNADTDTININTDLKSGKQLLVSILHETLHSMSVRFIDNYENNVNMPQPISQALSRLNGFKNQIIDNLEKESKSNFNLFVAKLAYGYLKEGKEAKIDNLLRVNTVHQKVKEIIKRVKDIRTQELNNETITDKLIADYINTDKEFSSAEYNLYYALTNLKEFVAISGTLGRDRNNLIRIAGGKYIEGVKNLFEKILEFLGITKDESAKFLNDIFTVSGIKEEVEVKPVLEVQQQQTQREYTPENVTSLKPNEVFVFGSNAEGVHGKGAALLAKTKFGAKQYKAEGLQGQSYAVITKKNWRIEKSSTLQEIQDGLQKMLEFAKRVPDKKFLVTKLGSSLAGYTIEEIKFLFNNLKQLIPDNVVLPKEYEVRDTSTGEIQEDLSFFNELEEEGKELQEKCKGSTPKAEKGMRSEFTGGSEWHLLQDLKGNTHEQGGIDVFIEGSKKYAKYGALISNLNEEDLIVPENKGNFTEHLSMGGWELVKDLKGKSHSQGGIDLSIVDGNVHFTKGESKIHAKCGCLIKHIAKAEEGEVVKTRVRKNKK